MKGLEHSQVVIISVDLSELKKVLNLLSKLK